MPPRSPSWRAATFLAAALIAFFGLSAAVIALRHHGSTLQAADDTSTHSGSDDVSTVQSVGRGTTSASTTVPPPAPTTTEAPAPPPPEPDPEPAPAPAPASTQRVDSAPSTPQPAPAPAPAPASSSCQSLSAGGLLAAHQSVHAFSIDGGLNASASAFAMTLCNAHVEDNMFHSGQAAGENLAWIQATSGCLNDGNLVVQTWRQSPAHNANLNAFSVVGGGVACDGSNTYFVAQYR